MVTVFWGYAVPQSEVESMLFGTLLDQSHVNAFWEGIVSPVRFSNILCLNYKGVSSAF